MQSDPIDDVSYSFRILNASSRSIPIDIEPWGDVVSVEAGAAINIEARGPTTGALEIEIASERLVLWGWPGSQLATVGTGGRTSHLPAPDLP